MHHANCTIFLKNSEGAFAAQRIALRAMPEIIKKFLPPPTKILHTPMELLGKFHVGSHRI